MAEIVVFDLDGTLLDSLADIGHALNSALAEAGLPVHELGSVRRMVGHGLGELVRQAVGPATDAAPAVLARVRQIYLEIPYRHSRPYPGIPEALAELAGRGAILAVLTNKAQAIADLIVAHFFPGRFALVRGEGPLWPRKPDPQALLGLLADLAPLAGLSGDPRSLAARAVLVGDSEADVKTALGAGARPIAVAWGFRDPDQLRAAGAAELAEDCPALLAALARA